MSDKVLIKLKAVGNAPILKQNVFKISKQSKFERVVQYLRKEMQMKDESLYCYINNAFCPSLDETIENLLIFEVGGALQVSYSLMVAWG
ncbi:ubiquitin-like protein Atg12 [Gorgonomyces haynaldii]|nr:ubiquitin-like protein Atg12 [Gorgonomyces haynaldii]